MELLRISVKDIYMAYYMAFIKNSKEYTRSVDNLNLFAVDL